jgi:hypothetical protein
MEATKYNLTNENQKFTGAKLSEQGEWMHNTIKALRF